MRTILFSSLGDGELVVGQNTFRKGSKYNDLKIGERVNLALTDKPDESIGEAVIRGVVYDLYGVLLHEHSRSNHGVLTYDLAKKAKMLHEILTTIYGEPDDLDLYAAIYLDRVL